MSNEDAKTVGEPQQSIINVEQGFRAKRLMNHLLGTLSKCKQELLAQESIITKRSIVEERAVTKRKLLEEEEQSKNLAIKQKLLEEREKLLEEKQKIEKERELIELQALDEMENKWERHHSLLSNFPITKLPFPSVNIYYKPKKVL